MTSPVIRRVDAWLRSRFSGPSGSIRFGVCLIALHIGLYAPLFILGVEYHRSSLVTGVLMVPIALWLSLPLAGLYGVDLGGVQWASGRHRSLAALGITLNLLYFAVGVLSWLGVAAGVHV